MDETKETVLTKQQIAVLDDIFFGNTSEDVVIKKHKVSTEVYCGWLNDGAFADEIEFRTGCLQRQSRLVQAKLTSYAAVKLLDLMNSEKTEVVRKACLDTISFPAGTVENQSSKSEVTNEAAGQFDSELAGRLLEMLAEEK